MMQVKLFCHMCATTFKIGIVDPSPTRIPYKCCPICGPTDISITVEQFTTEEYSFEVIAESWNISTGVLKMFYDAWVNTPGSPRTLKEFMVSRLESLQT